jgi:hypothetical protein
VDAKQNSVMQNLEAASSPKMLEQNLYGTNCKTPEHRHLDVKSYSQERNENIK